MTTTLKVQNGDIQYAVSGQLKTILDNEKVRQDVKEMLLIEQLDGLGASLINIIGTVDQVDFLRGLIFRQIAGGVEGLKRLQKGRQRAQRPEGELIDAIELLQVVVASQEEDPTSFIFKLDLKTVEAQRLTLSGTVFPTITSVGV